VPPTLTGGTGLFIRVLAGQAARSRNSW